MNTALYYRFTFEFNSIHYSISKPCFITMVLDIVFGYGIALIKLKRIYSNAIMASNLHGLNA